MAIGMKSESGGLVEHSFTVKISDSQGQFDTDATQDIRGARGYVYSVNDVVEECYLWHISKLEPTIYERSLTRA